MKERIKQHLIDRAKLTIFIDVNNKEVRAKHKCFESVVDLESTTDSVASAIDGLADLILQASAATDEIFKAIEIVDAIEGNDNLPKDFDTIH